MASAFMNKAIESYPLYWPEDRPRTPAGHRVRSQFSGSFDQIRRQLCDELDRLRAASVIISSNIPLRADGMPRAGVHRLDDPGIAVYFMLKKQEMCFACDKYALAWENMRAIQKTIEAIRGIERWGSSDMMQRAFRGFKAIPEKAGEYWREVLEIPPGAKATVDHVEKAFRSFAHIYHPDKGGTMEEWQRLVTARENALRDLGVTR